MLTISEMLEAARTIRPLLPNLLDAETAQQVDTQLAEHLNLPEIDSNTTVKQIRILLQNHASTQAWLTDFANTVSTRGYQSLPGDSALQPATKYICPVNNDYTWYREANEDIPLCPTHLVPLIPAQS